MLKKYPPNRAVLLSPMKFMETEAKFIFQQSCSFIAERVNNRSRTTLMVVVDLRTRPFQKAVVIEQLQTAQNLLRAVPDELCNVGRTEKAMPVDQLDN